MTGKLTFLEPVFDALPYPVFVKNERHEFVYGNAAFQEILKDQDFIGKNDTAYFGKEQVDVFWREDDRVLNGEDSLNEEEIGDNMFALTRKVPVELPGGEKGLLGIIIAAVTKVEPLRKAKAEYEEKLRQSAEIASNLDAAMAQLTDELESQLVAKDAQLSRALESARTDHATGLRNRLGFEKDMEEAIAEYERSGQVFGLAFLDIDHFKRINDRFGHAAGDLVLRVVGKRLRKLPEVMCVARIGGDEFAVITRRPAGTENDLGADLELSRQFVFGAVTDRGRKIELSGSVGLCVYPDDAESADELKRHADISLLKAKAAGRAQVRIFDTSIRNESNRRRAIESELPLAIENRTLKTVFQPIICASSRKILGAEVLARWTHPQLGVVSPAEFVPIANDIGLTSEMDAAVFEIAAPQAKPWLDAGRLDYISVNVSPHDIIAKEYPEQMLARLERTGVDPQRIFLEVIESSIVEDLDMAVRNLEMLSAAGTRIALDDYGTGFSNLKALLDLPLHRLKVDRSIIADEREEDQVLDLLVSITQLARTMNVDLVAEGVETRSQALYAEAAGFHCMQGYLFGRGVEKAEFEALLDTCHARRNVA